MTREQYQTIKKELKELATAIREGKTDRRNKQRTYSLGGNAEKEYFDGKITSTEWEELRPTFVGAYSAQIHAAREVENLRDDFRWRHILLSLARGKTLEQIEPKTAKDDYQKELNTTNAYRKVREMAEKLEVENFEELFKAA